ncbi:MAG TPA: MBL fold metallo-hydrolase [Rectinemataceae bacterium]
MIRRLERLKVGPIGENVYAIEAEEACILVDPGDSAESILAFLEEKGMEIDLIVMTHGHLDHTAAIPDLLSAWKARPPVLAIHALDAHYLGSRSAETNRILFEAIGASSFFRNLWRPMPEADLLLEDGQTLRGTSLRVIHTPGHSSGSICLYDEDSKVLVSGDTLFRDGIGRTDAPDSDHAALERSLLRLAQFPADTLVYPGHGPKTTIGRELAGWGNLAAGA